MAAGTASAGVAPGSAGVAPLLAPRANSPGLRPCFTPLDPRMALVPDEKKEAVSDLVARGWKAPMVSDRVPELMPFLQRSCKEQRECYNHIRPMTPVLDVGSATLWLGSAEALKPAILNANAIGGVVDCTGRIETLPPGVQGLYALDMNGVMEGRDLATALCVLEAIDDTLTRGDFVLVNCLRGANRSPVMAILYCMVKCAMTWEAAVGHVSSVRGVTDVREAKWGYKVFLSKTHNFL